MASHNQREVLSQLTIRNFAIIDRLEIDWSPGLNVITGETGAGKSILIDAVGALLGDRLGPDMVRSGAQRALIEGVFAVPPELASTLEDLELQPEDGALIVSREIAGSGGRGIARVNGRGVPISVLQALGERLVDVHGQSEHMALLRAREQLEYLDRYAGALPQRAEVGRLVRELRSTRAAYEQLMNTEREAARMRDMLRHEIAEIEAAALSTDEEDQLTVQRSRLEHVERLRSAAQSVLAALAGEDDAPGATDLLARAAAALREAARIDPGLIAEDEAVHGALAQAQEAARAVREYVEALEADPRELERIVERLFRIGDLKRKYGETIADVLDYADDARRQLLEIDNRADRLNVLRARADDLDAELGAAAGALSSVRQAAAGDLSHAVLRELADLRLADAQFDVRLEGQEVDTSGGDRVEFQIGEERRAIARVASGGELARIALALKTVLTRAETRPTLIFDEVDVGIGGRTAPVVGEKLWAVAAGGHQVLCVTHMPQVAAFADTHFVVSRSSGTPGDVCVTHVDADQRVDELAAMLAGGITKAARQSARELLQRARATKQLAVSH